MAAARTLHARPTGAAAVDGHKRGGGRMLQPHTRRRRGTSPHSPSVRAVGGGGGGGGTTPLHATAGSPRRERRGAHTALCPGCVCAQRTEGEPVREAPPKGDKRDWRQPNKKRKKANDKRASTVSTPPRQPPRLPRHLLAHSPHRTNAVCGGCTGVWLAPRPPPSPALCLSCRRCRSLLKRAPQKRQHH